MDITINGARFYVVEVGLGLGAPLVALHGGLGLDHREPRPYLDSPVGVHLEIVGRGLRRRSHGRPRALRCQGERVGASHHRATPDRSRRLSVMRPPLQAP